MFSLLLIAALTTAEIPHSARTETTFARLIATRLAMHFAHGTNARPKTLFIYQSAGRVEMRLREGDVEHLLMIGLGRTQLAKRMQPLLKKLTP